MKERTAGQTEGVATEYGINPIVFMSELDKEGYQHLIGVMGTLKDERMGLNSKNWELQTDKKAREKTLMKQMLKMLRDKAKDGAEALRPLLTKERKRHFECAEIIRRANHVEQNEVEV